MRKATGDPTCSVDNKSKLEWSSKVKEAFELLKGALNEDIELNFRDFNQKFLLGTDANKFPLEGFVSKGTMQGYYGVYILVGH